MKDQLQNHINDFKNILDTMPTNNIKNRTNKKKIIKEEKMEYQNILRKVTTKLISFKDSFSSLKPSNRIKEINISLETCKFINEWNKYNSAYEKMHLDYYLYLLSRYYKEDLNTVNDWLITIISSFKTVGININYDNFKFNVYAKKYIKVLLENKEDTKKIFDEVYWKSPNLLKTIELNLKSIYITNQDKINHYYKERRNKYLETHKEEDLLTLKENLETEKTNIYNTEKYYLIDNFVTKKWSISDYNTASIEKKIAKYFKDKNIEPVIKLKQTLLEYKLIIKYKNILEDMKTKINNKNSYKGKKTTVLKEINKLEKELIKLNHTKNETKISFFKSKKKDDKLLFKYNETVDKLNTSYENLDTESLNERISNCLNLDSTILEVFRFITSNFLYFVTERKKEDDSLTINMLNEEYLNLQSIINRDNFIFINHIALLDEQNLEMVITDKYKLENINLEMTDLEPDNLESTIKDVDLLFNYLNIKKANLELDDITNYLNLLNMDIN